MQLRKSRREFLTGSLAISTVLAMPASAESVAPRLPQGAMVLTRRVERELHDGLQIVVTRKWRTSFARHPQGIEIHGRQILAEVSAPAKVSEIGRIEEQRITDRMFPIWLTRAGIIERVGPIDDRAQVEAAVLKAKEIIARLPHNENTKAQMRLAVDRIQAADCGALGRMPSDLFFPSGGGFEDRREMPLPDGSSGEFELIYNTKPSSAGPWLAHAERLIVTRIGQDSRHSREVWGLESA